MTDTQWQVDFNLALPSFEPHIQGICNLVRLAHNVKSQGIEPRILFTSSVGIANDIGSVSLIPEEPLTDLSIAGSGYGESKLIAESLLKEASDGLGIDVAICRVGQISGPVKEEHQGGIWNRKEWFPSVSSIAGCRFLSSASNKYHRSLTRRLICP